MKKKFLLCGCIGCCLEVFWTGISSLVRHDFRLKGHSSIWMFPIYGLAFIIFPASLQLKKKYNFWVRGSIYAAAIFSIEFLTGCLLGAFNMCPWDYSKSPYNIRGVIRLDYAPVWFFTGLFFEKILGSKSSFER